MKPRADHASQSPKSKPSSRIFAFLFGLPFFGMGAFFMWIGGLQPIVRTIQSQSWQSVPCTIQSSSVGSHYSSDGNTYSIDITYRYTWEGETHVSSRYNFTDMSSSGRRGKERVVRQYPEGQQRTCFIDPAQPSEAVLSRELGWVPYFVIPFSGIFVAVGGLLMAGAFFHLPFIGSGRRSGGAGFTSHKPHSSTKSFGHRATYDYPEENRDPATLKPEMGRVSRVVAILVFSAFWNGIIFIFIVQVVDGHLKGNPDWFLTLFMIPFLLVGVGLILAFVYTLLALFNPRVEVTVTPGTPRMGYPFQIHWRIDGNTKRLRALKVILEAEEIATYQRGTDTVTVRNIFEQVELTRQDDSNLSGYSGYTDLSIPSNSMHSFKSSNNQILWTIKVQGNVPKWPDLTAVFPIDVLPAHPQRQTHDG